MVVYFVWKKKNIFDVAMKRNRSQKKRDGFIPTSPIIIHIQIYIYSWNFHKKNGAQFLGSLLSHHTQSFWAHSVYFSLIWKIICRDVYFSVCEEMINLAPSKGGYINDNRENNTTKNVWKMVQNTSLFVSFTNESNIQNGWVNVEGKRLNYISILQPIINAWNISHYYQEREYAIKYEYMSTFLDDSGSINWNFHKEEGKYTLIV